MKDFPFHSLTLLISERGREDNKGKMFAIGCKTFNEGMFDIILPTILQKTGHGLTKRLSRMPRRTTALEMRHVLDVLSRNI